MRCDLPFNVGRFRRFRSGPARVRSGTGPPAASHIVSGLGHPGLGGAANASETRVTL
jgi:hypothetical protein